MKILAVIIFVSILANSCCFQKCVSLDVYAEFRILSAVNGSDLVFGPSRIYDKEKIKFYGVSGQDTIHLESTSASYNGLDFDSTLAVQFHPKHSIAFMALSNGDVDTLAVKFRTDDNGSFCCRGSFTEIESFEFNGSGRLALDDEPVELRK